jgi:hypothetical protein
MPPSTPGQDTSVTIQHESLPWVDWLAAGNNSANSAGVSGLQRLNGQNGYALTTQSFFKLSLMYLT